MTSDDLFPNPGKRSRFGSLGPDWSVVVDWECARVHSEGHSIGADHGTVQARRRRKGDCRRRHSAQTRCENHAKQVSKEAETATAPFQYALSHRRLRVRRSYAEATVTSIDGIGACDLISWNAMLEGLLRMEKGDQILPFVRCFYGTRSTCSWDDEMGVTQHIHQGEGGEQGDPLMPMLFALGQHPALAVAQERLRGNELRFAYLDDVCAVCRTVLGQALRFWNRSCKRMRKSGCAKVWNRGGVTQDGVDELQRRARRLKPEAVVWKVDPQLPQQGVRVLGVPIGGGEFVRVFLEKKNKDHETLFQRIPWLNDPQSAWLLLLMCASTRANFWLRSVHPDISHCNTTPTCGRVWTPSSVPLQLRAWPRCLPV